MKTHDHKTRLNPLEVVNIYPFSRATQLTDMSLYWIPVATFPIPTLQRQWLLQFLTLLKAKLSVMEMLRAENFLQLKALQHNLHQLFSKTAREYHPCIGLGIPPGGILPETPSTREIKSLVENAPANGQLNLDHLAADYCCWFANKQDERQRADFFGVGGMTVLFLKPDPATTPPDMQIPNFLRTHPALRGKDPEASLKVMYAFKDGFLAKSKETFASHLKDEPIYAGLLFVLPLLTSGDFVSALPEERQKWFDVFHGYCIESRKDKGVLLAFKDPGFDPTLQSILREMRDAKLEYPA